MDIINFLRTSPLEGVVAFLIGLFAGFAAGFRLKRFGLTERIDRLEEEKKRLESKIAALEEDDSDLEQENNRLQAALRLEGNAPTPPPATHPIPPPRLDGIPNVSLRVTQEEALRRISSIPGIDSRTIETRWRVFENRVSQSSACWLFVWAFTGQGSENARRMATDIFNDILDVTFDHFNAQVGVDRARGLRYRPHHDWGRAA